MSLPFETQASFLHFLKFVLSIKSPDITFSASLRKKIAHLPQELYDGILEEVSFELLVQEVLDEINEPMVVWKIIDQIRFSQILAGNPITLYLLSSPDAKTCFMDFIKLRHFIFPPSYSFNINETNTEIVFEITEKGHKSMLPHIKEDLAVGYLFLLLKDFIGPSFDFSNILVPVNRKNLNPEVIKRVSCAEIIIHDGPAQAIFSKSFLDYKNDFYNLEIQQHYSSRVSALLTDHKPRVILSQKIISFLKKQKHPVTFSINKMAAHLNKSTSTLRRNLSSEKTSYKQLQNQVLDKLSFSALFSSDYKIEEVAQNLGYSERSSFDRAFRNKFGCPPTQFRAFAKSLNFENKKSQKKHTNLEMLMSNIPPLLDTCNKLLISTEDERIDLNEVVKIIKSDPVFTTQIMEISNHIIYGRRAKNLHEVITNKVGIKKIISVSILAASRGCLSDHISDFNVKKLFSILTLAPEIFQQLINNSDVKIDNKSDFIEELLHLSLLGLLLLLHTQNRDHIIITTLLYNSSGLKDALRRLKKEFNISLFGISMLMLACWGADKELLRVLSTLEKKYETISEKPSYEGLLFLALDICFTNVFSPKKSKHIKEHLKMLGVSQCNIGIESIF